MEIVAFDTETSGAYPLDSELCEVAAVRWVDGKITGQFQSLAKPSHHMSDFIIGIHGITNEMVADAPPAAKVARDFCDFVGDSILVAHHAAFDLGFLALEMEKNHLPFPGGAVLCSSLLARAVITETPNHKLQTLVQHFQINGGQAHRALDDAKACLDVTLRCLDRLGGIDPLKVAFEKMGGPFHWVQFSVETLRKEEKTRILVAAIESKSEIEVQYGRPGEVKWRRLKPAGLVRGPNADYFVVRDSDGSHFKRYFLNRFFAARN